MSLLTSLKNPLTRRRIVRASLLVLAAAYIGFCADFYFRQEWYLLEPHETPTGMKVSNYKGKGENLVLSNLPDDDGEIHYRKYTAAATPSKGTVFYLHGNRGDMDQCEWEIDFLLDLGYDVWTMDYRGFGRSRGTISESALKGDALMVLGEIIPRDPEDSIIIWGRSFGSGVAASVAAAAGEKVKMLVLETPYWSLVDLVRQKLPFIPPALFRYELPTHKLLMSATCPIHLIHGTQDEKIPHDSSDRLHDLKGIDVTGYSIMSGKHNLRDERTLTKFEEDAASILK